MGDTLADFPKEGDSKQWNKSLRGQVKRKLRLMPISLKQNNHGKARTLISCFVLFVHYSTNLLINSTDSDVAVPKFKSQHWHCSTFWQVTVFYKLRGE